MYNKVQKGLTAAIRIQYFTTIIRTTASIPQKTPYQEHAFESHFQMRANIFRTMRIQALYEVLS